MFDQFLMHTRFIILVGLLNNGIFQFKLPMRMV